MPEPSQDSIAEQPSENLKRLGIDLATLPDFSLIQQNDPEAWGAVIHYVTERFHRCINSKAPDISPLDREDLFQEVLIRLFSNSHKLAGWLQFFRRVRIYTLRSMGDFFRKRKRQAKTVSPGNDDYNKAVATQIDDSFTPEEQLFQFEKEELVDKILSELPTKERTFYENYFIAGSIQKLAALEGIPHSTAQHKLTAIREKIRRLTKEYEKP